MPREARNHGEWGYLHLIARGIGKQILFEEKGDFLHFLHLLKRFSSETNVAICAYCLMDNHFHLLVYDPEFNSPLFMKKLEGTYAVYFNRKYERSGHLFQNRYKSRAIDSEDSLITVFRYILNNPYKAGISSAAEYPWNSYHQYGNPNSFVDTTYLQELLGSFTEYAAFINANEDDDTDIEFQRHDDDWAIAVIRKTFNISSGTVMRSFDKNSRNAAIRLLKEKGLSIRQIERLTGISKSLIQRI